jgi:general L-amino acid transport system permease protein
LQAIDKGQYEAAEAMGLTYWQSMRQIILPQALTHVIPGIVNTFIGLFKDTTLVSIIGLFDLLGAGKSAIADASWSSPVQAISIYLFVGFIFFIFCFGMSRYSIFMENKLSKSRSH